MPIPILVVAAAIPVLWLTLFVKGHALYYAFRDRYPEEAEKEMRHAFEFRRDPSKFLYFISADSDAFLRGKMDCELLVKRRWVVRLAFASVILPFGGMGIVVVLIATGVLQ